MYKMLKIQNLLFRTFGRLTVMRYAGKTHLGAATWLCVCSCGQLRTVTSSNLVAGLTLSCGCLRKDTGRMLNLKHGKSRSRVYLCWISMRRRCYDPRLENYSDYGGRGIKVCDRWKDSFDNFYADMGDPGEGLSLDRKDVNGDYTPENCRWATVKEQERNKTNNRLYLVGDRWGCVPEIAEEFGLNKHTLFSRVRSWGDEGFSSYVALKCGQDFPQKLAEWNASVRGK